MKTALFGIVKNYFTISQTNDTVRNLSSTHSFLNTIVTNIGGHYESQNIFPRTLVCSIIALHI